MAGGAEALVTAPGALPLVGHIPQFLRDRLGFLTRCARSAAAVVRIRLEVDAFLLLDAGDIKHVLEANHFNYTKSEKMVGSRGKELSGYGLLTAMGQRHLDLRRVLAPVFSANSMNRLAHAIVEQAGQVLDSWREGEMDLADALMELAQCINGRILFGVDYRKEHADLAADIRVRRSYMHAVFSSVLPFAQSVPTRQRAQFKRAQRRIVKEVDALIALRRQNPSNYDDLLARFMEVTMLDEAAVREEAVTTSITGYETIGEGWAWTCLLLMRHPEVLDAATQEVDRQLGGKPPASSDLAALPLVQQVLAESMRLYPPTWIYVRMAQQEDQLPSGVSLPPGAKLYLCPWVIHRSERYFPDPLRFDPGRFEPEARRDRPKYAYFPFGGGPRVCIGQALAKLQMPLVLAMVLQRFRFTLIEGQKITPQPRITLSPSPGIRVKLCRRL